MKNHLTRREFLATSAAVGAGLATSGLLAQESFKTRLRKAVIVGRPTEANLKPIKEAGFDGVEVTDWKLAAKDAAACRETAQKVGVPIHCVLFGWAQFNKDKDAAAKSIAEVEASIAAAQAYGADALLLVPCRIGEMPMPEAWEFQIEFDEKTGHLKRVAAGDNDKYKAYMEAHDQAVDSSIEAVKKLIPAAQKAKVVIALENVWNNLWVKPAFFQSFVASFQSEWVKAYLDLGNCVKYSPTEDWVKALGSLLVRCHVKDFKLNENGHGGKFVDIRDGSVNWPVVRKALDDAAYSGWMTIEGGKCSLAEHSKRLDLIIAGK